MNNEKFEKLDNEQKELVKYWIEKFCEAPCSMTKTPFIEKYLTPEPVIEVGKWYKRTVDGSLILFFCTKITDGRYYGYGFGYQGRWCKDNTHFLNEGALGQYRQATPEEVEQRLIEEANKIYEGKKLSPLNSDLMSGYNSNGVSIKSETIHTSTYYYDYAIWAGAGKWSVVIFCKGKWAEIIDEKDEIRESVARLESELQELKSKL